MDRALVASLIRPRRIVTAVVVFLAFGGMAGLVVGAVAASDGPVAPASFAFAVPHVGDRGHYQLTGEGRFFGITGAEALAFEVHADGHGPDQGGVARTVNRIGAAVLPASEQRHEPGIYQIDASTGSPIALERHVVEEHDDGEGSVRSRQLLMVDYGNETTGWLAPCGLRHELQGTLWDLAPRRATTPCSWAQFANNPGPWIWVADGVADAEGVRHLRAHLSWGGAARIAYEFRSDTPYPVRLTLNPERDEPTVLTLVAYEPGAGPAIATAAGAGGQAPPLAKAPRPAWLADDTGVDHPFPLSQAWAQARDDPAEPAFRDYLAQHPRALVKLAAFQEYHMDNAPSERTWHFTVSDGQQQMRLWVQEPLGAPSSADLVNDTVGTVQGIVQQTQPAPASYEHDVGAADGPMPDPSWLPADTPTVASMLVQWDAYKGHAYQDVVGNSWRLDTWCYDPCASSADMSIRMSVGHGQYVRTGDQDVATQSSLEWSYWEPLGHRLDRPWRYSEDVTEWRPVGQANGPAPQRAAPATFAGAVGLSWTLPGTGGTLGVGASALVAAFAYWLWPAIKGGAFGLFSRVHKDRLLDNPLRQRLLQRIEAEPGIHHNALVRELGKGKGTAEHHLEKMVAGRVILRHRSPGYTCYFPVGTDHRAMPAASATKADGARLVLDALRRGQTGVRAIAAATGLSPSTVSHHLSRLRAAGLVVGDGATGFHAAGPAPGTAAA